MSKLEKLLQLDPQDELLFKGPFNLPSAAFLRLTNVTKNRILFKIKTTAPKKYCVRPNSGILEKENHIDVVLSLQPFAYDSSEKNKHKFLIQSALAPDGNVDLEQIWREIPVEQIFDNKLRCVFQSSSHEPKVHSDVNTTALTTNLQQAVSEKQEVANENELYEENKRLKEEIITLKKEIATTVTSSSVSMKSDRVSVVSIVSGLFLGIMGFIFGKYAF